MTNYRAILEYHYKGNTTTQSPNFANVLVLPFWKRLKGLNSAVSTCLCQIKRPITTYSKRFIRNVFAKKSTPHPIFTSWKRIKRRENSRFSLCGADIIKELWLQGKSLTANRSFSRYLRCIGPIPNFTFNRRKRWKKRIRLRGKLHILQKGREWLTMREAWEKLVLWCKKMRLNPYKL